MHQDNEQVHVDFHNQANSIFVALFQTFESAVNGLNRQTEEYKFQQAKETYIKTLKQRLESCATQLMQEHRQSKVGNELSQNLQQFIKQYLHLVVQKTKTA